MNGYEINILLESENDSCAVLAKSESSACGDSQYLEEIIPKLFKTSFSRQTRYFALDSLSRNTNEIVLSCYGTKYPEYEIGEIFSNIKISGKHAIKIKTHYDGDGPAENYCIVNSEKCSIQKYNAFYRNNKIGYKAKKSPTKLQKKKVKPEKTEAEKIKIALIKENQQFIEKEFNAQIGEDNKMAIIRLLVRSKSKRELVKQIFNPCLAEGDINYEQFCNLFNASLSSEEYEVSWCYLKSISVKNHTWSEGPEDIIRHLNIIFEQGNYIYLGFKLESLPDEKFDPEKYRVEMGVPQFTDLESLAVVLSAIEGVSKASIKYRPKGKSGKEYYVYYPDSGREPSQAVGSTTKDYEWPTIG